MPAGQVHAAAARWNWPALTKRIGSHLPPGAARRRRAVKVGQPGRGDLSLEAPHAARRPPPAFVLAWKTKVSTACE
eukprot:SAG22_NODE_2653_length_2336_cov_2.233110_1_plen_76_part_00